MRTKIFFLWIVLLLFSGAFTKTAYGNNKSNTPLEHLYNQFLSFNLPQQTDDIITFLTENFDADFFSDRVMQDIASRLSQDEIKELKSLLLSRLQKNTKGNLKLFKLNYYPPKKTSIFYSITSYQF